MLTLLDRFYHHARARGGDPAYREFSSNGERRRSVSFAELAEWSYSLSRLLNESMSPGSVVLICHSDRMECVVGTLAALSAGHTALLVSPQTSEAELLAAARQSGATAALADGRTNQALQRMGLPLISLEAIQEGRNATIPELNKSLDTQQGRPGLMLLSSGSTGEPKIVFRDGASLDAVSANMVEAIGITETDRVLMMLPLCHSYGFEHGLLAPIYAGCTVHLCHGLDSVSIMKQWHDEGITVFPGVPSMFELLAANDATRPARTLRCAYSAGAPLPDSVYQRFYQCTGVRIGQLYGSTEVGSVTFQDPSTADYEPSCVGYPMRGVDFQIVDPGDGQPGQPLPFGGEGEVAVRAPSMLSGYVGDPKPPFREGYFMTGDLGRMDEAGRLHITGRLKLLIDIGGLKVNPLEVESVLIRHPHIQEAAVVPVPVTETVCRLKAIVVPVNAASKPLAEDLRSFVRHHLSAYKVPRIIEWRNGLPRTPSGKLKRADLVHTASQPSSGHYVHTTSEPTG